MLDLLPSEYWKYNLIDVIRGMAADVGPNKQDDNLYIHGLGFCLPVRSARAAIIIAIKALNLKPGSSIGVPLYCCSVVFKAIEAAGCKPCFIDINPETFCMSAEHLAAKSAQLDVVIAVHMFGNLCDMPGIREAAQGKPIIEDCAQSLGSKIEDRMAGAFGTIAAFSFRSGKYLSVGEGGALFSRHADISTRLSELVGSMPIPSFFEECTHVVRTYVRSKLRSKPLYGLLGHKIWEFYNKKVGYSSKTPIDMSQIYRADLATAIQRLSVLDSAIERQRANADFFTKVLNVDRDMLCFEMSGTFYNRYLYPIMFPSSEHRDLMTTYLYKRQICCSKPYSDIPDIASRYYGYEGDCPVAEQVAKRVLVIPIYHSLKRTDVEHIARCVNEGWSEMIRDTLKSWRLSPTPNGSNNV